MGKSAIVIGAGVIGVASAYALARRGWQVSLLDKEPRPAMGTSHANGAQLSYCFTDALGSPATLAALPRLLSGRGGVSIRPGVSADYLRWLASFARNCTAARFRENTLGVLKLALESRAAMDALCERHAVEFAHANADKVQLLYTDADRRRAEASMALKAGMGCEQSIVDRDGFAQIDPALPGIDDAVTAVIYTRSEKVGDARKFCENMLPILVKEYGVTVMLGMIATAATLILRNSRIKTANIVMNTTHTVTICERNNVCRTLLYNTNIPVICTWSSFNPSSVVK